MKSATDKLKLGKTVYQTTWKIEKLPCEWVLAEIASVYKGKGTKGLSKNYGGITLFSILGKVYGRVVGERVNEGRRLRT